MIATTEGEEGGVGAMGSPDAQEPVEEESGMFTGRCFQRNGV